MAPRSNEGFLGNVLRKVGIAHDGDGQPECSALIATYEGNTGRLVTDRHGAEERLVGSRVIARHG